MPISGPSFFPTFKALGGGAPDVTVPITQLCFDTSAGPPYQGWVWNYSIATWERFGGAGGGGFPTTENVNSTHAGVTLGNKNVSYITTDGTGTVNNVTLPAPPVDAGTSSALWTEQWHIVILKVKTNVADTVLITVNDPAMSWAGSGTIAADGFDAEFSPYNPPTDETANLILTTVGQSIAFKWNNNRWFIDITNDNQTMPKPSSSGFLGINGIVGDSSYTAGQDISVTSGYGYSGGGRGGGLILKAGRAGGASLGGSVNIRAGDSSTTATSTPGHNYIQSGYARPGSNTNGGYNRINAGNGDGAGNGGNTYLTSGNGGATGTGGYVTVKGGYGYNGGDLTFTAGNGSSNFGGNVGIYSGAATTKNGSITIKTHNTIATLGNDVIIETGNATISGANAGAVIINGGSASISGAIPGDVQITSGNAIGANCGNVFIEGGLQTGGTGVQKGGNIVIQTQEDNVVGDDIGAIIIQTGSTVGGAAHLGDIWIQTGQNPVSNPDAVFQPGTGQITINGEGGLTLQSGNDVTLEPSAGHNVIITTGGISLASGITVGTAAEMISSSVNFTNGAGAGAGTLTNAPAAGNPTKWIGVNDNGVLRHIPAW